MSDHTMTLKPGADLLASRIRVALRAIVNWVPNLYRAYDYSRNDTINTRHTSPLLTRAVSFQRMTSFMWWFALVVVCGAVVVVLTAITFNNKELLLSTIPTLPGVGLTAFGYSIGKKRGVIPDRLEIREFGCKQHALVIVARLKHEREMQKRNSRIRKRVYLPAVIIPGPQLAKKTRELVPV